LDEWSEIVNELSYLKVKGQGHTYFEQQQLPSAEIQWTVGRPQSYITKIDLLFVCAYKFT